MILKIKWAIVLCSIFPIVIIAQAEDILNGIRLEESLEQVTKKITKISETSDIISIDNPSFPLAKLTENHLVCSIVKTENGVIGSVVFTFADNKLVYIEAKGNTYKAFTSKRRDSARTYLDYEVYVKDKLFVDKEKDIARIMTEDAMHTNLFTWENPYLNSGAKTTITPSYSDKIPEFLKIGHSMDEVKPLLEANSSFTNIEELDGSDPNAQLQINCFGVNYLGFPRKVEARFGDGKLNVVWILTAKGEESRIRKALIKQYGNPIFVNENWEIFNDWQVGLRKDKPEVLLIKKEIGLEYKTSYFKQ